MSDENLCCFVYFSYLDPKETDITCIRIYALDKNNKNICLRVNDFTPYIYLELPLKNSSNSTINWQSKAQILGDKIDEMLEKPCLKKKLLFKHKLYGAQLDNDYNKKVFPYLLCSFSNKNDYKKLMFILRKPLYVPGIGQIQLKMHEQDASEILQLFSVRDIPTAGWIKFKGINIKDSEKITLCDREYTVSYKSLFKFDKNELAKPKIMSFDIEVNSSNVSAMPNPEKPDDKVFQISCVFYRQSLNDYNTYILTLGEVDQEILGDNINILMYEHEADLLEGFTKLIRTENPNVITGYNILKFDIEYMIKRAESSHTYFCMVEFDKMGFNIENHCDKEVIKWSSSAFKNQEFKYLNAEGRIFVDLLPIIQRDYKLNNYKLSTVSDTFIGDNKADLSPKGIFKCYRDGIVKEKDGTYGEKAIKAMTKCASYCIQDSLLVVKLMEKLDIWTGITEMAKTTNISIFDTFTQGQQKKVYSQIYKFCMYENIVVEKDAYITKDNERYVGAHVFPPVPGIYERVLPFDFCFSGDTLVSLSNGLSKRIDSFDKDKLVLGFNKESNAFENFSFINGLQKKGIRDTVKIYFQDGSSIVATPEHKFMLENGEWCKAEDLKDKYVKSGIKFPEDKTCELEKDWNLDVEGYNLNMKNDLEREKSLAFARMLGYILTDGSIYISTCNRGYTIKCVEACFGTMFDALTFKRDINLFSDIDVSIRKRDGDGNKEREIKGTTLSITIPANLSKMFHSLEDIIVGKRATQEMKLPKFILDDNCPLSIIREFLGGLFGGDGTAPCLCKDKRFGYLEFKWTIIKKYFYTLENTIKNIQKLLLKFDIVSTINKPLDIKYTFETSIKPKDLEHRTDLKLTIKNSYFYIFNKNLTFKYCIQKSYKLYISSLYENFEYMFRKQLDFIIKNCKNIDKFDNKVIFDEIQKLKKIEPLIFEDGLLKLKKRFVKNYKNTKIRISSFGFPKPIDYLKDINMLKLFDEKYLIKTDDINIPSFRQKVIDVREYEPTEVFDIEVDNVHNFLANGITASNCSLYPTTLIAYNIDYSTWVSDESIPDTMCNIMDFEDHIGCEHDPKVIEYNKLSTYIENERNILKKLRDDRDDKKNKHIKQELVDKVNEQTEKMKPFIKQRSDIKKTISKNPMCAKRYYRFLKEPKGVIPTILQNLLDARKNTRKEIKENKLLIQNLDDSIKINELKSFNNVLEKRQLAYKVCCNSVYGILGVKKGLLPFMPAAMCCTYMGRVNIEKVANTITTKYKGQLVYGDTDCILATEPVLIKYNNILDYKTVEELSDGNWSYINPNKEISKAKPGYQIWSDDGFTNIINVVKCGIKKPLSRVLTHIGVVNCSNEHSLLTDKLESITPLDIKIGDKLCISELPLPKDTPIKPLYNNKITKEIIENYIIPNIEYEGLTAELAFVWGLFFVDGYCDEYSKSSWGINNQDNILLKRVYNILKNNEKIVNFKIYDIMKFSNVNKLEIVKFSTKKEYTETLVNFISKYHKLFYDNRKYKKIPTIIFNSPFEIRQSFFMGYYSGDINKKESSLSLSNKGAIGSAGLFYLMRSIGYKVTINTIKDKLDIYKLSGSTPEEKFRYEPNKVKKIMNIKIDDNEYIYDIQTENHHFAAGVGQLVVHNSNYITFPHLTTAEESWNYAEKVADEISDMFPKPIKLEFEAAIYWQFFILTKKRYMYKSCGKDGVIDNKIGKKGVLLARRDNALIIRNIYEKLIDMIFNKNSRDEILYFLLQEINRICSNSVNHKEYVITKSVGDINNMTIVPFKDEKGKMKAKIGNYIVPLLPKTEKEREKQFKLKEADNEREYYERCLPAVIQLTEKMRNRGQRVDVGSRLEYVITDIGYDGKQYEKIEHIDYFLAHKDVLKINFLDYLKLMINPIDEALNVAFNKNIENGYKFQKDFMLEQYNFRYKIRDKYINELKNLFNPKLAFKSK